MKEEIKMKKNPLAPSYVDTIRKSQRIEKIDRNFLKRVEKQNAQIERLARQH